jgi:hypothetical protein
MGLITMSKEKLSRLEVMQRMEEKRLREKAALAEAGI